jgi:hypothetical protein
MNFLYTVATFEAKGLKWKREKSPGDKRPPIQATGLQITIN